ncbi:MAG: 50S ribosomal protein L29 [Arenicellales bacterium]
MNASELRTKSSDDLQKSLVELRQEQFNLRMQRSSGQLANPARFKAVQKDIARIKTVMTEMTAIATAKAAKAGAE